LANYRLEAPPIIKDFLRYLKTSLDRSDGTINEYFLDLRTFFRFLLMDRAAVDPSTPFDEIQIDSIDLAFIKGISKTDLYNYIDYLRNDHVFNEGQANEGQGLSPTTTRRRLASIKTFFNYLCEKVSYLDKNPTIGIDVPRAIKSLPTHLTEDQSFRLLGAVQGEHAERDYCILVLFLSCGLRVSEIVGIDTHDISIANEDDRFLTVFGKGKKMRQVYLGDSCIEALTSYLAIRKSRYQPKHGHENALFLSRRHQRISVDAVQNMVKRTLLAAGINPNQYSAHKLRHTAATLMLKNGVDVRTLQEILGHEQLNTTQIYTHIDSDSLRVAAKANPISRARRNVVQEEPHHGKKEAKRSREKKPK